MTQEQMDELELLVVSKIAEVKAPGYGLDDLAISVHAFAVYLATSAFDKLDDALRDPED